MASELVQLFQNHFEVEPQVQVKAPGRINLLGGHTDYNDGMVLPVAIDRYITVIGAKRDDRKLRVRSLNLEQESQNSLDSIQKDPQNPWADYIWGVMAEYQKRGYRPVGMNLLISGDVPMGGGLSSSAAVDVAIAETARVLSDFDLETQEMARICQKAESLFAGVRCGIMDPFVSIHGKQGSALLLDCRSLGFEIVPFNLRAKILGVDSAVPRQLHTSGYNARRRECDEALYLINERMRGISSLRDLTAEKLRQYGGVLPVHLFQRAAHVVEEIERVKQGAEALRAGQGMVFGKLMVDSHKSLRDNYQVSIAEMDLLVDLAMEVEGVLGSRMTGGGFGGWTVNLVSPHALENFKSHVIGNYREKTGRQPVVWELSPSDGVWSQELVA